MSERVSSRLRASKPIKTHIYHGLVYAHQMFAMTLLSWLQDLLELSAAFRAIFSSVLEQKDNKKRCPILETIFRHDTSLWKSARAQIHHLLISGLLKENDSKREFAMAFTRNYGQILKDFITDDHDHSFSISSMSVQLFTVPTLSHHLIRHADVLPILLRTFISDIKSFKNNRGKLNVQRSLNEHFRSFFMMYDLKYLLSTTPDEIAVPENESGNQWDTSLRKGFLHGFSLMTDILGWMQGMDEQIRQTSADVFFELEWRSAFTFHLDIWPPSALMIKWCISDRLVFIKAVRMLFKKLNGEIWRIKGEALTRQRLLEECEEARLKKEEDDSNPGPTIAQLEAKNDPCRDQPMVFKELNGISAECIEYQVSTKPVSMHQPVTRVLASLCQHMGKYDLSFDSHEFDIEERPSIVHLMEPALRTIVFSCQINAGMWRRNRDSLLNQVMLYQNPSFRKSFMDPDVIMLQWCGAQIDPNEFMIHLLNRFQFAALGRLGLCLL